MTYDPLDQPERLAVLKQLAIMDTPAEPAFDRLTHLVARLLRVPVAQVTLLDSERQFFKSAVGMSEPWMSLRQTSLSHSFCQYCVRSGEPFMVTDARAHALVQHSPAITDFGVVAYAGIPLITSDGFTIGSLCAIDSVPRVWSQDDLATLHDLAASTIAEIELRNEIRIREEAQAALHKRELQLRAIIEHVIDPIFVKNRTGRYQMINPAGMAYLGLAPDDSAEQTDRSLFGPENAARMQQVDQAVMQSGVPHTVEERIVRNGVERIFITTKVPYISADGGMLGVIGISHDITARRREEQAHLDEAELRFQAVVEAANDAIVLTTHDGRMLSWNLAAQRMFGYTDAEAVGQPFAMLLSAHSYEELTSGTHRREDGEQPHILGTTIEMQGMRQNGSPFPLELSLASWRTPDGLYYSSIMRDRTQQKQLEAQLLQSQKLESVGRLAGGIAHDFNNLLTGIIGYADLALDMVAQQEPVQEELEAIRKASFRAAKLTRQLLTFARQQQSQPEVVDINALVLEIDTLLRRLIGADVELVTLVADQPLWISADLAQLEQVLVNLVVNARDAMPHGGKITLAVAPVVLDEQAARAQNLTAGAYGQLVVSDTGVGMTADVQQHLFEPFFTTKELGKGTGLGLAICYGVVAQHNGAILVDSTPGQGSAFTLVLPCVAPVPAPPTQHAATPTVTGTETILLVEDEPAVRTLTARMLRLRGYTVLEATNGEEALRLFAGDDAPAFALLLTDIVMPQLGGIELAQQLAARRPDLKIVFMSGYVGTDVPQRDWKTPQNFIQKPFTTDTLTRAVRAALDDA